MATNAILWQHLWTADKEHSYKNFLPISFTLLQSFGLFRYMPPILYKTINRKDQQGKALISVKLCTCYKEFMVNVEPIV